MPVRPSPLLSALASLRAAIVAVATLTAGTATGCRHVAFGGTTTSYGAQRRVLLGRLVIDGDPASNWVGGGLYAGAELVIDDHLTVHDGREELQSGSTGAPDAPFANIGAGGGPIRFGGGNGPIYVLGLRVSRALVVLRTSSVFPILVRIPEGIGPCDYIGTIHLRRQGDETHARVVDDYGIDAPRLAKGVRGCSSPSKNLGQPFDVPDDQAPERGKTHS